MSGECLGCGAQAGECYCQDGWAEWNDTTLLRDQFAMAALTGLLANPRFTEVADELDNNIETISYEVADVMLKVRGK